MYWELLAVIALVAAAAATALAGRLLAAVTPEKFEAVKGFVRRAAIVLLRMIP